MNYICSENHHYTYGTMSEITVDGGAQLWQLVSESGRGMTTGTASGPLHTSLAYDLQSLLGHSCVCLFLYW